MNGIFVETPFAKMIVNGEKKYDFRKQKPPTDMIGNPLYLICEEGVIGEVMITNCRYNQVKHSFYMEITIIKKYSEPKTYQSLKKNGEWVTEINID